MSIIWWINSAERVPDNLFICNMYNTWRGCIIYKYTIGKLSIISIYWQCAKKFPKILQAVRIWHSQRNSLHRLSCILFSKILIFQFLCDLYVFCLWFVCIFVCLSAFVSVAVCSTCIFACWQGAVTRVEQLEQSSYKLFTSICYQLYNSTNFSPNH